MRDLSLTTETLLVCTFPKPTSFILNMINIALKANLMPSITKKCSQPLASTKERMPVLCRIERTSLQTQITPAHVQEVTMMEAVPETGPKQYGPLLLPL